ncbi:TraC family protein [Mesorhizobium microcysteis]|uniref:TraC family protein n=1 Tax=Neoaquamicrobium microcysteis TaxID=2682781 RepID=A0A5D4H5W4_9HYPH|nr:TraC family protein [Mesorhizobium microcysteis]TYR36088.1 TraC family protein [Mesorhizobium microcysteis]
MRRPTSRIREEIERLQEQLKLAEAKEAERIGRLALKAGLGDVSASDAELVAGFEEMAKRFQTGTRQKKSEPAARSQADASDA